MSKKVGRKSNELTEEIKKEAQEILDLAFEDVGTIKSKLTYNSVCKFNERIANNEKYIRANGELFNKYPIRFWSREYKGTPYYGKKIIDEFKQVKTVIAGESFEIDNEDINSLVDRYHKKPDELKKRLSSLFEKDRKLINDLKFRNENLTNKVNSYKKDIEDFQEGFATLFWNSSSTYNSLDDVITLERKEDNSINKELLNMFGNDEEKLLKVANNNTIKENFIPNKTKTDTDNRVDKDKGITSENKVLDIQDKLKAMGLSSSGDKFKK